MSPRRRPAAWEVTVLAPAKINLGLEILGRRPDGFHDLVTILQAVRLTDRIRMRRSPTPGITLTVRPAGCDLGPPERNLARRAAALLLGEAPAPGLEVELTKRIPAGGGYGGGSADAAGVLAGLNQLRGFGFSEEKLEGLGAELGSDVPFFIRGGTQAATGRGEILRPMPPWPGHVAVLVFPNLSLSTALAYQNLTLGLTPRGVLSSIFFRGFSRDFWSVHPPVFENDLEPVVMRLEPKVARILAKLSEMGAKFVRVTGSGSGVFGLAPDSGTAVTWSQHFCRQGYWSRPVRPARGGCQVRSNR